MESIVNEQGQILRSPSVLSALRAVVERYLGSRVGAMAFEDQAWSALGGVRMTGTWRATGTTALIKLGINVNQLYWTQQMAEVGPDLGPVLYASGEQLGELPIRWTAMERIAFGPLGLEWNGHEFPMLLDAAVRFQRAARRVVPLNIARMDVSLLRRRLQPGVAAAPPGPVATVMDRLEADWEWVASTCALGVCHADIHMCNALTRTPPPQMSDVLLIDCQPIVQPWAFDAARLQVLNSIDRDRVGYRGLVQEMARIRSAYGLPSCEGGDLEKVARLALAWFAIRLWGLTPGRHTIADYRAVYPWRLCFRSVDPRLTPRSRQRKGNQRWNFCVRVGLQRPADTPLQGCGGTGSDLPGNQTPLR